MEKEAGTKVLTFLLPRSGCLPYAGQLLAYLSDVENRIYVSAYATEPVPIAGIKIKTYRHLTEAVGQTLLQILLFARRLFRDRRAGYRIAYFPVFHQWNLYLIPLCRLFGIYTIYTVHNARLHAGEDSRFNQWSQRRCMNWAHELICLTKYVQQQAREMTPTGKRITVIPHGLLQLPGLSPQMRTLPAAVRLLFLGRIEPYKGIDLLLQALQELSDAPISELIIAGKAPGQIEIPAGKIPVTLINKRLDDAEMVYWMQNSDILVMPYTEATQSGVLTLAITAALPCVCTRVGGLPEQLAADEALWVAPTVLDLARGIRTLATDPERYRSINRKLLEKAGDTGWQSAAEQVKNLIDSVGSK